MSNKNLKQLWVHEGAHKKLKIKSAKNGLTLAQMVDNLIKDDIEEVQTVIKRPGRKSNRDF